MAGYKLLNIFSYKLEDNCCLIVIFFFSIFLENEIETKNAFKNECFMNPFGFY